MLFMLFEIVEDDVEMPIYDEVFLLLTVVVVLFRHEFLCRIYRFHEQQ